MLTYLLIIAFVIVLGLMVVRQRNLTFLMSLAGIIGAVLTMIWLQNQGLLPGTQGPLSGTRPQTLIDAPKESARVP